MTEEEKSQYLKKFRKAERPMTKAQTLAEEIWLHLNKEIPFGRLTKLINDYGYQWIYECYQATLKAERIKKPVALFLWRVKQVTIQQT